MCEIVFCGLAIRIVNIIVEMPIAENGIRYQTVIDRSYYYKRELKARLLKQICNRRTLYEEKKTGRMGTML